MSETYAGRATARFGQEADVKAEHRVPPRIAMPQAVAWAIVVTFVVAALAMGAAPFVERRFQVVTGLTAGIALLCFFCLVGMVKSVRSER